MEAIKYLGTQTFKEWSEDKASRLAAALSYYTVFSLPPLLLLAITIVGWFVGSRGESEQEIQQQISQLTSSPAVSDAISQIVNNASQDQGGTLIASIVSIVTLLLGASGVFIQLQDAMNTIWGVEPDPDQGIMGAVKKRVTGFSAVFAVGFLLLVGLFISTALSALGGIVTDLLPGSELVAQIVNFIIQLLIIAGLFALLFKYIPDVEIQWSDVLIGAFVTSLLFNLGRLGLSLYLSNNSTASAYGAAGSLILLLLWVYYSAQIFFLGAEFTQVYANRYGSHIRPDEDAISMTDESRAQEGEPREETVRERKREQKQS